jgi:predicted permease
MLAYQSLMPLAEDVRYALRTFRKAPSFALTAVLALALGIGANVAIFSLVDALLIRPLPLAQVDQLVDVCEDESYIGFPRDTPAPANFVDWKQRNHVFSDMGALRGQIFAITGDGSPEQVEGNAITANLLPILGVSPILGRNILSEEDRPGANRVALISYRLWQQRYGAARSIVGRNIILDGVGHRIIGVMPRGFAIPERSDIWIPMAFTPQQLAVRGSHYLLVMARLRPGIGVEDAQRDLSGISRQLAREYPDTNAHVGAVVIPLRDQLLDGSDTGARVLAAGVGCVLLISCANLAGLLLARGAGREREMAIRAALGARRRRLLRQGLVESLVLALAGGLLAILMAAWTVPLLGHLIPTVLSGWAQPEIDPRLLGFAFLVCIVSAVLSGTLPALKFARVGLAAVLQHGGRTVIGGRNRLRRTLVVAEVALAVVLCVGAGLMLRTVWGLSHVDLGFHPEHVLTLRTSLPMTAESRYAWFSARSAFYRDVLEHVRAIPGVQSAGYTTFLPLTNRGGTSGFSIEGAPPLPPGEHNDANHRVVTRDYLQAVGVPLLSGRFFNDGDGPDAPLVAIVNQAMAQQYWPNADPIGRRIFFHGDRTDTFFTVVGIVGGIRQMGLDVSSRAEMYFPATQAPASYGYFAPRDLAVRVHGDPLRYAAAVREAIWSVDPNQPISDVMTMEDLVAKETTSLRTQLWLLGAFAGLALLLAAIGLYGLLSQMVTERTRDIGVRMALGARRSQVVAEVMRQGLILVLAGLAAGVAGALWQVRLMEKLVYGVKTTDPATFTAVILTLLAVGALACYLPARRATRIDPMQALRQD